MKLEVYSRLCSQLFENTWNDDVKVQQRHRIFDTVGPCLETGTTPEPWDPEAIEALTQYCREWRDRNDMTSGEPLEWNLNLHLTVSDERIKDYWQLPLLDANTPLCNNHSGTCNTINLLG
jgi:hypothetical protein